MSFAQHMYKALTIALLAVLIVVVYREGEKVADTVAKVGYGSDLNVHMVEVVNKDALPVSVKDRVTVEGEVSVNGGRVSIGNGPPTELPVRVRSDN